MKSCSALAGRTICSLRILSNSGHFSPACNPFQFREGARFFSTDPVDKPVESTKAFPEIFVNMHPAQETKEPIVIEEGNILLDSIELYDLVEKLGMPDLQKKLIKDEKEKIVLPKLSVLINTSADKFKALFPDNVQRNRLKYFLRKISGSPIASDKSPIVIPTLSTTQIQSTVYESAIEASCQAWVNEIKIPEMFSPSETGFVQKWLVNELEELKEDVDLCEVDTSIGVFMLKSPEEGVVSEFLVEPLHELPVNTTIAVFIAKHKPKKT